MLKFIELTNFGVHETLRLDFSPGLNALRGANEAGKSTIYRAVMYAFVGSRSLPLSLEETVTRGKPISSLKVKLCMQHNGTTYTITRSKSGAELVDEATLRVSGQAEVTKYVEQLLNANADILSKIPVASQNAIRGALEGNQAVALIEKLAGVGLIDELVTGIQDKLPSGSTKLMEAQYADMAALPEPSLDLAPYKAALATELGALAVIQALPLQAAEVLKLAEAAEVEARKAVAAEEALVNSRNYLRKEMVALESQLSQVSEAPTDHTVEWAAAAAKQAMEGSLAAAYTKFSAYKVSEAFMPQGLDMAAAEATARQTLQAAAAKLQAARTEVQVQKAMLITQTACGLCGKDLTDVPEVVTKNSAAQLKIVEAEAAVQEAEAEIAEATSDLNDIASVKSEVTKVELLHAQLADFTQLDTTTLPPILRWVAEIPGNPDRTDYAALQRGYNSKLSAHQRAQAAREAAQVRMDEAQAWWAENGAARDVSEHLAALEAANQARADVRDAERKVDAAERAVDMAKLNLKSHTDYLAQLYVAYEANKATMVKLRSDIAEVVANNELIKALREARPAIAAKLWQVVLSAVSRHFSAIRGVASVVGVKEGKFLVDGFTAEAVSGSTLDALGLAIRVALGKTFLPTVDFLMLDEPGSGMDDERETAMLGLLASVGYAQVVVVTHSTLADSYAASVLTV